MRFTTILATLLLTLPLHAQHRKGSANASGYDNADRATLLHNANLYVTADSASPPVYTIAPGHEVVIAARNDAPAPAKGTARADSWLNVFANTDTPDKDDPDATPEFEDPASTRAAGTPSSGWIRDKGVVTPRTPNGAAILFGAAADYEAQAEQPHGPKEAAPAAHRLYQRVADYFPDSPLAPEASFRAADIRWQLDKLDNSDLPSAHEQDPDLRPRIYEGELRRVMKLYPNSPFAARADFDLLDAKLCGDWQGLPKCPELETNLYLKYADHYPGGPKSAEALYDAAYRQGVVVTMYNLDENPKQAEAAARNCQAIAEELRKDYPASDFTARAAAVAYRVSQGIAVYGSDRY
jgi:hypothetical protein